MNYYANRMNNTPQNQPVPGQVMVPNNAGGYAFQASTMIQLRRFLVLGTQGGSYYVAEKALTRQGLDAVYKALKEDPIGTVNMIVEVSQKGQNVKQNTVLFALAAASTHNDVNVRKAVYDAIPLVCRTASQLFEFMQAAKMLGRTSSGGFRRALTRWYMHKDIEAVAYQMVKYRTRSGWSHRDMLRYASPSPRLHLSVHSNPALIAQESHQWSNLFAWAVGKPYNQVPEIIHAYEESKRATTTQEIVSLITRYNLPREALDTKWLNEASVWEALLEKMPITALIRNLAKMTQVGLIGPFSQASQKAIGHLTNQTKIQNGRVHPLNILKASRQYAAGKGDKGSLTWTPHQKILEALDTAFELSFVNVEPIQENILVGIDSSGSMSAWNNVAGIPGLRPLEAGAALAKVYLHANPSAEVIAFDTSYRHIPVRANMSLQEIFRVLSTYRGGGTDMGFPFRWARENNMPVDGVITITDGESWSGPRHTFQEVDALRRQRGKNVRWVNVQSTMSETKLSHPTDKDAIEIPGFGSDTVQVANLFFSNQL